MSDKDRAYPSVGDCVTVLSWVGGTDRSWVGTPLKVLSVDAPFVAVVEIGPLVPMRFALDARQATLMRLSPEFVEALQR